MRPGATLRSSSGFTYITVLVMVVVMGIMLGQAAQVWKTTMQREKETELLFRGMAVREAMQRYYWGKVVRSGAKPQDDPKKPNLKGLDDLLKDPSEAGTKRYLRPSALKDPMTGKDWALVKDAAQKIIGVASTSEEAPIKQANFPWELMPADFEKKKKYSEWQFIYNRIPTPAVGGGITGLGGSGTPQPQTPGESPSPQPQPQPQSESAP